ncbi:MAG: hypothetical protein OEV25_16750, partial [Deltaproteobacteria bacterium]|nr:hypothetical protein [Deltaproteobacteria bacterium]
PPSQHGSLARALRALESSEGSEKKMVADVVGSLKGPAKQGVPIFHRDKWRGPQAKKKQAWSCPQALSIKL